MQDEAAELAAALGEAQQAQIEAEGRAYVAEQDNMRLKRMVIERDTRITVLEKANMDMDALFQEFRVGYKPSPAAVDRG